MNFSQDFFNWLEKKGVPSDSWKANLIMRVLIARNLDWETSEGVEIIENIIKNIVDPNQNVDAAFKFVSEQIKEVSEVKAHEQSGRTKNTFPTLTINIIIGTSPQEEVSDLLSDISILYRKMGGSGINFTPEGTIILSPIPHEV